jgi:hypothetical protein
MPSKRQCSTPKKKQLHEFEHSSESVLSILRGLRVSSESVLRGLKGFEGLRVTCLERSSESVLRVKIALLTYASSPSNMLACIHQ